MSEAQLHAINCTNCGSALPALAGGKARSLTCGYCGSVMDRHEGYRVLAQYRDMPRPAGPFRIGMTGEIAGVAQTIVGIVGWESRIEGEIYSWTDYQLYSPTHGYSWLTWNDGHLAHSRKVREAPDEQDPFMRAPGGKMRAMGLDLTVYEQYEARIFYVEGELTWVAQIGQSTRVIEAIDPPYGYEVERSGEEEEYGLSTYLDRDETLASFGVTEPQPRPLGVHAIQPFRPGKLHVSMARAAKIMLPFATVLMLAALLLGGGSRVATGRIDNPARGGEVRFEAPYTDRLMMITLRAPVANSWAWYDFSLTHEDSDTTIVELSEGVEYYYGYEGGESWTEGSREAHIRFRPPAVGAYLIEIEGVEEGSANVPLTVVVRKDVFVARWLIGLTILFALIAASLWSRRHAFERARWGGGDEDDDDD